MLNEKTKNIFSLILRLGLSSLLLLYLFHKIDLEKMLEALKSADFLYIYYAAAAFLVINFIILVRWIVFIKALGINVPFKSVVNCYFIGLFFNLFLPSSTGGDIVKTFGLFRDTTEKARVVASVVSDRLSGFVSICLVALIAFLAGQKFIDDRTLLVSILMLASASIGIVLILFNEKIFSFCCGVFNKFPKVKISFMRLHYAVVMLKKRPGSLLSAVMLSSLSQAFLALTFYLLAKGLHQDIAMIYFFIFVPLICVVASLPSIGGLGVRDAGAVYLFSKVGVNSGITLSITLINFLFMVVVGLLGGIVYVMAMSPKSSKSYLRKSQVDFKDT